MALVALFVLSLEVTEVLLVHLERKLNLVHVLPGTLTLGLLSRQFDSVVIPIRTIQTFQHLHRPAVFIVSNP